MYNNNQSNKDNDTRKIFTTLVLVLTLMIFTTGATYAYFAISAENSTPTGTAASVGLTLSVTEADLKAVTNTGVMVPQLETALKNAMNSTNKCVDGNNNIICKVYTISITNDSNAGVRIVGTIKFSLADPDGGKTVEQGGDGKTNYSMSNLKWKRATSITTLGTTTGGSYDGVAIGDISYTNGTVTSSSAFDLTDGTACIVNTSSGCEIVELGAKASTTYYIVVWINAALDENTGEEIEQTDSGKWIGTVAFTGENGKGVTSTITS